MSAQTQTPAKAPSMLKNVLVIGGLSLVFVLLIVGVFARNVSLAFMTLRAEDPATHDVHAPSPKPSINPSDDPFDAMADDLADPAP